MTFGSFLASVVGVSALAGPLGLGGRGQALAALFCATLPNGILQTSGAKNDWLLTLFLVLAVYFAARRDAPFAGVALRLALDTKATSYLFAPAPILAFLTWTRPLNGPHSLLRTARDDNYFSDMGQWHNRE